MIMWTFNIIPYRKQRNNKTGNEKIDDVGGYNSFYNFRVLIAFKLDNKNDYSIVVQYLFQSVRILKDF
jgi:hypothetical protein